MKCQLVPSTAGRSVAVSCLRFFVIVLATTSLGVAAGCGGDQSPSGQGFSDRLENIKQQGSEQWGRVAQQAEDLRPGQPLTDDVKQPMSQLVSFQRRAAAALRGLTVPDEAAEEIKTLIEALRDRTEIFNQALQSGHFTRRQFDRTTEAGNRIDQAFDQLREKGFLPTIEEHKEK